MLELVKFQAAKTALEEATRVDEVKSIRDKAEALRLYFKQQQDGLYMQNQAAEIKLHAERKAGQILTEMVKAKGRGNGSNQYVKSNRSPDVTNCSPTLAELGITKMQSHRWQKIAAIEQHVFEKYIEDTKQAEEEITTKGLLDLYAITVESSTQNKHKETQRPLTFITQLTPIIEEQYTQMFQGNALEVLKTFVDKSVHMCVTSPPYWGLRDYGTASWEGGDEDCDHTIPSGEHDPKRSGGDSGSSHTIRFNRSECHNCGAKLIDSQLGLEKTPEEYIHNMIEVFREVRRVLKDDGTLWLNLGDSYNAGRNGCYAGRGKQASLERHKGINRSGANVKTLKPKELVGIPWRVAFALQADGWYLRQDIIWHKPNPMPESVTDRCTKAHEYIFLLSKSQHYYFDNEAIKERAVSAGSVHVGGNENHPEKGFETRPSKTYVTPEFRNKRSVWTINTQPYPEAHFATFPSELPELCIKAGSKIGDIILDPFMGSGTTALVAHQLNRNWIGIELSEQYIHIAQRRLSQEHIPPKNLKTTMARS